MSTYDINFLIGAGASVACDLPSMKDLVKDFIPEDNSDLYKEILETVKKYQKEPDIESIMSIIVSLMDENIDKNLDDFALFILMNNSTTKCETKKYDIEKLKNLEEQYKKFIRYKLKLESKNIEDACEFYDRFFAMLYNHFYPDTPIQKYSEKGKGLNDLHVNFNIFTTNYDVLIEKYFKEQLDEDVYTGFEGPCPKRFVMNNFDK
jgi:hypothetical protein